VASDEGGKTKLSVARLLRNEQKLRSARILSLQVGKAGVLTSPARAKALFVKEITQSTRTHS